MTGSKKPKQWFKRKTTIGIAAVVLIAVAFFSAYSYLSAENVKASLSGGVIVTYKDGTLQKIYGQTLVPGQIVMPSTGAEISSIRTQLIAKPIVKASDGTYPTSISTPITITKGFFGLWIKDVKLVKNFETAGKTLLPNQNNIILDDATTITQASLDSLTSDFTNGQLFTLQYYYAPNYPFEISMGGQVVSTSSFSTTDPTIIASITLKKAVVATTPSYTLQSVQVSGGFK